MNRLKALVLATGLASAMSANAAVLELAFILDGSGSINSQNYDLQLSGYQNVLASGSFFDDFIAPSIYDEVYFSAWQFSATTILETDWTLIDSNAAATAFGNTFNNTNMDQLNSTTNIQEAIETVDDSIENNGIGGGVDDKKIVDISTDGVPNRPTNPVAGSINAASEARAKDIEVNAIGIGSAVGADYLESLVGIGSTDPNIGFFMTAENFQEFESTLQTKIAREILDEPPSVPEPSSLALFGIGALALGRFARRKNHA